MYSSVRKQLSVLIVNYKSEKNLFKCLLSLKDFLKNINYEIILVNNDENALSEIKEIFLQITTIEQNKNIGFGRAINLGARKAEGEVFLILNPDTEIISGRLEDVFNEFSGKREVGIIGSRIVNFFGETQPWIAGAKKDFWDLFKNNLGFIKSKKKWQSDKKIEVGWVAGTAMFIKRELFEELLGFDENFFLYFEDIDICERAKRLNKKIFYFPDFVVKHLGGASFSGKKDQKKHYYDSQEYYFKKHRSKLEFLAVKLLRKLFFD